MNEDIVKFNPSTLDICNSISCSVCKNQNGLVNAISLNKACRIRRHYIINRFIASI